MTSNIFPKKEKEFLLNPKNISSNHRKLFEKRIKERLQCLNSEEFKASIKFIPIKERINILDSIMNTLEIHLADYWLRGKLELLKRPRGWKGKIKKYGKEFSQKSKKLNLILGRDIESSIFWKIFPLIDKLSKEEIIKKVETEESKPNWILEQKKGSDEYYLERKTNVKRIILSLRKKGTIELSEMKRKGRIYRHLIERGILECQKTKNKNILPLCKKQINKLKKLNVIKKPGIEKINKFIPYFEHILPFEEICTNCKDKKNCKIKISEYGKNLAS